MQPRFRYGEVVLIFEDIHDRLAVVFRFEYWKACSLLEALRESVWAAPLYANSRAFLRLVFFRARIGCWEIPSFLHVVPYELVVQANACAMEGSYGEMWGMKLLGGLEYALPLREAFICEVIMVVAASPVTHSVQQS
jgi:hypothetical protein